MGVRTVYRVALALAAAGFCSGAPGQAYPNKPIRMLVPFPAGGPTDILARILGQRLSEALGQGVVIDNRGGGGGTIAALAAARATPDGYALLLSGVTTLVLATFTHRNLGYDPLRDFAPIAQTSSAPILLMTHPSFAARSIAELIAAAKAQPGRINYATSGPGGSGHLAGELFKITTGVDLLHIPYKGAAAALNELIAGQVPTMFGTMLAAIPHIRSGRLRALAVTGVKRSSAVPDVPTFAEAGWPNYDANSWNGMVAPAGTPRPIIDRLNTEIVRIMRTPNVLERLVADGTTAVSGTPEEFVAFIQSESIKWGRVVRQTQLKIE